MTIKPLLNSNTAADIPRLLDRLPLEKVVKLQAQLDPWLNEHAAEPVQRINTSGELEPHTRAALVTAIGELLERLEPKGPAAAQR